MTQTLYHQHLAGHLSIHILHQILRAHHLLYESKFVRLDILREFSLSLGSKGHSVENIFIEANSSCSCTNSLPKNCATKNASASATILNSNSGLLLNSSILFN